MDRKTLQEIKALIDASGVRVVYPHAEDARATREFAVRDALIAAYGLEMDAQVARVLAALTAPDVAWAFRSEYLP